MEEHMIESACGEYTRNLWLVPSVQARPQTLCVFLDAEYYLERMETLSLVSDLQAHDRFSAVTWVFVSHGGQPARHSDYICNSRFARYIAEDVIGWVRRKCAGVVEGDHLICGLSLSGLASAYLALTYPQQFSRALCQSGAFWWNREWLARNAISESAAQGRFWISVGEEEVETGIAHPPSGMLQEVSQLAVVENVVRELEAIGATVHFHRFAGGHQTAPWQAELHAALGWLLQPTR
jgi:enterochelin esterase family protein